MQVEKISASGNDFLIFHALRSHDRSSLAKKLCHRQYGIGADGLIVLLPQDGLDFRWEFYNSDGSHADMCSNGTRAAAFYAFSNGLASQNMRFLTGAGEIDAKVDGDIVRASMPQKDFLQALSDYEIYNTGVPHVVIQAKQKDFFDIQRAKDLRQKHDANVNFCFLNNNEIYVRTFERGVEGETLACGTGMVASYLACVKDGSTKTLIPKSGERLEVFFENETLYIQGKVSHIAQVCVNKDFLNG